MKNKTNQQLEVHPSYIDVPSQILGIKIKSMKWSDFKGKAPSNTWFLAHIYWGIFYNIIQKANGQGFDIVVTPKLNQQRAWVDPDCCSHQKLLEHEYGHFMICCLLALQFKSQMLKEQHQKLSIGQFRKVSAQKFKITFNKYLRIQRQYDQETNHYLNREEQLKWQQWFKKQFLRYKSLQSVLNNKLIVNQKRGVSKNQRKITENRKLPQKSFRISAKKR